MFGIGPTEIVIIGLLLLVLFGPRKLPSMTRDLGRFVNEARSYQEELKNELLSSEEKTDHSRNGQKNREAKGTKPQASAGSSPEQQVRAQGDQEVAEEPLEQEESGLRGGDPADRK